MPKGTIDRTGEITITFNPSTGDALVIAGRRVLPCETCGEILDFDINGPCYVSVSCEVCAATHAEMGEGCPPYDAATATGMYD